MQSDRVLIHCDESHTSATTIVSPSADARLDPCGVDCFVEAVNLLRRSIFTESNTVSAVEDTTIASGIQADIRGLVRSYLILPIWVGKLVECTYEMLPATGHDSDLQTPWSILIAYNVNRTRKWQDWEINFLQRLTTQVMIAIAQSLLCCQLQTANQKLQQLAILDGLTEIANRRYFDLVVTSSLIENEGVALLAIESLLPNASYLDKMMSFIMPPTRTLRPPTFLRNGETLQRLT